MTTSAQAINPEEVGLSQSEVIKCYPNPFNNSIIIYYKLSEQGHVSLRVYNMYGQAVSILFDGYQTEGQHEQTWNAIASNGKLMQNGNYFIRLESENTVKTIKVMLMR